jgi:transcriptional regulator GlxA family with amidase domain
MNPFTPSTAPLRATVLVLPESSLMSVASVIDPMRACNRVSRRTLFDWRLITTDGGAATLSCGLDISSQGALDAGLSGDLLFIIGGFNARAHLRPRAGGMLAKLLPRFGALAGIEAGSWVLAKLGALDGRSVTTHWEDLEDFAQTFPEVSLRGDRFVVDGLIMTAGGASPAFDLMLHLIRNRFGKRTAMEVASIFIYEETHAPGDAQRLVSLGRIAAREPRVAHAIRLMEASIDRPMGAPEIARRLGMSGRHLESLFRRTIGESPGAYFLKLRLQTARRLVVDTGLSMQDIAVRTGFSSLSTFSRSFRRHAGVSGVALRRGIREGRPTHDGGAG